MFTSALRMVKVLAPMLVKLLLMPFLMASMADSIPTRAVMPMLMISIVINALKRFALIESRAMSMFSRMSINGVKLLISRDCVFKLTVGYYVFLTVCLYGLILRVY